MNKFFNSTLKIKHAFYMVILIFIFYVIFFVLKNPVNHEIKIGDIIIAIATLLSPIVALQIQSWIENIKSKESRKLNVFETLMATRATPLNYKHVEAINMISTVYYGDTEVINALKAFLDVRTRKDISIPSDEYSSSLVNLLKKMAHSLGLNFYDDEIRNGCYRPNAHVYLEDLQIKNADMVSKALEGGKLHIVIDQLVSNSATQNTIQEGVS